MKKALLKEWRQSEIRFPVIAGGVVLGFGLICTSWPIVATLLFSTAASMFTFLGVKAVQSIWVSKPAEAEAELEKTREPSNTEKLSNAEKLVAAPSIRILPRPAITRTVKKPTNEVEANELHEETPEASAEESAEESAVETPQVITRPKQRVSSKGQRTRLKEQLAAQRRMRASVSQPVTEPSEPAQLTGQPAQPEAEPAPQLEPAPQPVEPAQLTGQPTVQSAPQLMPQLTGQPTMQLAGQLAESAPQRRRPAGQPRRKGFFNVIVTDHLRWLEEGFTPAEIESFYQSEPEFIESDRARWSEEIRLCHSKPDQWRSMLFSERELQRDERGLNQYLEEEIDDPNGYPSGYFRRRRVN